MPKKTTLYFDSSDSEKCYPLDYHLEAAPANATQIELYEAVPEKMTGMFWCCAADAVGENGTCGKQCDDYAPRNGKSGICRYRTNTGYTHGNKVVIPL